jgi:hypothetical protein
MKSIFFFKSLAIALQSKIDNNSYRARIKMKSKFEQFISEVLKSPEKVEIQHSSNEYLNYQTEKAIQTTKSGLKIASSFIKMGIAAAIIAAPALAAAGELTTSKYQDELRQVVKVSQDKGYLTAKMNIDVKENKYTGERYGAENHAINQADVMSRASCDVTITLSKTGERAYMAHDDDIKSLIAPKNETQKKLRQIALEIANKGTFTVFSTYAEVLPELFEQNSMIDSTLINAVNNSVSNFLDSNNLKFKLGFSKPSEYVSFFKQLGYDTINKANLKRKYDSDKQIADLSPEEQIKLRAISRDVFHERYGDDFEKIDAVSDQFKKYITSNHKPVLDQKTDTKTIFAQLEEKRVVMLKEYEVRAKELESTGSFMDKANVLKNIQSLRPDTSKTATFSPS